MENAEEVMHSLEEFSKLKPKEIPKELEDYLRFVAKTGDPVFKWSLVKCLYREKLLNVITDFYERTLSVNELPPCPNVDPFNYERMKANLLEKLDSFPGAPFTVQRISELLTNPSKEYKRADKFMRAIEKNILVVSIREPGRYVESDDSQQESSFNGIPGHNESGIEAPFACNDLADADSSSQSFEANQQPEPTTAEVSSDLSSANFKENGENVTDSASTNGLDIMRNDDVSQEIIIEEKDTETVICSTLPSQTNDELSDQCENIAEESKITELTVLAESSDYSESSEDLIDSNTPDSKDLIEENKETIVTVEVTADSVTVIESAQMDVEDSKDSSNVVDSSNRSERLTVTVNSNDSSEESSESSSSQTFEESKPAECDTSNSFDSETSNSCDSEVEIKNAEEEVHQSPEESLNNGKVSEMADSTEINEATCSGNEITEENHSETIKTTEPDEVTIAESTDMEVGECQISQVDQSDS